MEIIGLNMVVAKSEYHYHPDHIFRNLFKNSYFQCVNGNSIKIAWMSGRYEIHELLIPEEIILLISSFVKVPYYDFKIRFEKQLYPFKVLFDIDLPLSNTENTG